MRRSVYGGGLERRLLFRIFSQPLGHAAHHCHSETGGRAESTPIATGDAVVVEGLDGFGLAAPDGTADEMAGQPQTASLETAAPQALAEQALTHLLNLIIQSPIALANTLPSLFLLRNGNRKIAIDHEGDHLVSLVVHSHLAALLLEVLSGHFLLGRLLGERFLVSGGFLKGRKGGHFAFADGMDLADVQLAQTVF
jgi:hypothetical protein